MSTRLESAQKGIWCAFQGQIYSCPCFFHTCTEIGRESKTKSTFPTSQPIAATSVAPLENSAKSKA